MKSRAEAVIVTAVIFAFIYIAKAPLVVVLLSILLAFVTAPVADFLHRGRLPRSLAAFLALLLFLGGASGIAYLSYNQFVSFAQDLPKYSEEIRQVADHVRLKVQKIQQTTRQALPSGGGSAGPPVRVESVSSWTEVFGPALKATETALYAFFVPFLMYFMLTWRDHVRRATVRIFKEQDHNNVNAALGEIASMLRMFLIGNLLIGLFIGTISMVVFWIIGVPHFYFVGYISGFLSLVPYLGVLLALLPPVAASLQSVHSGGQIAIIVAVLALHVFSLNVLYPKFLGKRLQLNPFASTLGLLFWGWLWGGIGLLLAIPIMGALKIVFDHAGRLKPYGLWLGDEEAAPVRARK